MGRLRQLFQEQNVKYSGTLAKLTTGIGEITPAITQEQYDAYNKKKRRSLYEKRAEEINKRLDKGQEVPPYSFEDYKKEFE